MSPNLDIFSLRTGVLVSPEKAVLLAAEDELAEEDAAHTYIFQWSRNRDWQGMAVPWTAISVGALGTPNNLTIAIGDSQFIAWGGGNKFEGQILPPKTRRGPCRAIKQIAGHLYTVGMGGLVYRCNNTVHNWVEVGIHIPTEVNFESISGYSEEEIYAVGWKGEMWVYDGSAWSQINTPTNVILTNVCCAGDGYVYCCGQQGILIRGRKDSWRVIEQDATRQDFWDVHWFDNKLWISTITFLYNLDLDDNDALNLVKFTDDIPSSCYHLTSSPGVLWSIGAKDVMAFDGKAWKRIL